MPLPNVQLNQALQCHAKTKSTGSRCKNLAAYGMPVCRYHGARKPNTIQRGIDHPNYKHGDCTQEALQTYREASMRLREIETIAIEARLLTERMPGRKLKH